MLIQYAVSNYKSIKDEIIINFARIDGESDDNWTIPVEEPRCRLYNVIGLMGPIRSILQSGLLKIPLAGRRSLKLR